MIEPTFSTATTAPEQEDVTTGLYRAAIGPVSNDYYLPIFTRFEAADRAGITWNTAAALCTLNWLAFRKLWGAALAYAAILLTVILLVFGIGSLVFQLPDTLISALALGFGLAAFVLPGLFGNAVFHTDCRKRMSKALVAHSVVRESCDELLQQASTRRRAIIIAVINVAFLLVAALVYWQVSSLSNLSVMPQGALEPGSVAMGPAADSPNAASAPMALSVVASSPALPVSAPSSVPALSFPLATASAADSAPASAPEASLIAQSAPIPSVASSATIPTPVATVTASSSQPPSAAASATTVRPVSPASAISASSTMLAASAAGQKTPRSEPATLPVNKDKPAEVKKTKTPDRETSPEKTAKSPEPAKDLNKAPAAKPVMPPATKPYYINVGLFAVAQNAERAHAKLIVAGLPSVQKELKSSKGPLIRVRVGPFVSKQEAQVAIEKIKALQLEAMLVQP